MKITNKKIKDICKFIGGSQPPKSDFIFEPRDGYIRLIQIRDRLNNNFATYIPVNLARKKCYKEDILIGRYGPPVFQIFRGFEGAYNVAIMKAKPLNGTDNDFLYYFLQQNQILKYVESMQLRTAGQTGVELDSLYEYPVRLPDLYFQKKIARILVNLDLKISLNNKIIAELEAMAKTLYDYWFLQFDFPDENGKPYRSSGGKMVYNEELKREIPEGWEVGKLGDFCDIRLGGTPDTENKLYWNGTIHWLNSGEVSCFPIINSEKTITKKGMIESSTSFAPKGSVLLSITRYIRPSILGIDSCFNQSVIAVLENDVFKKSYLYPFFNNQVARYMTLRTGAQQPHINKDVVSKTYIIKPHEDILNKYNQEVDACYELIISKSKEMFELNSLRDFLLPMLMNGQVTFKNIKED